MTSKSTGSYINHGSSDGDVTENPEVAKQIKAAYRPTESPRRKWQKDWNPGYGYDLVEPLGEPGGFGEVWKAKRPGGLTEAALKIIEITDTSNVELEALEKLKGLRHEHLIEIHAYWFLGGT